MRSPIVWFDIPVRDLERFYSAVPGEPVRREEAPGVAIALFPHEEAEPTGCLFRSTDDPPSNHGPLLYFDGSGRRDDALAAAEASGGTVLQPKQPIGEYGFRAIVSRQRRQPGSAALALIRPAARVRLWARPPPASGRSRC